MKETINSLLDIMRLLRDPQRGCPWDLEQDFSTIAPYTIEEAYEVADAIQRGDIEGLRDELGDLLLQVVFHAQMASEKGLFDFEDVVASICEKMIRRHPHVFADAEIPDADAQSIGWEDAKERERMEQGATSLLDGIPRGMAELQRSVKLQKRAARAGFDWPAPEPVLDKLREETGELVEAMREAEQDRIEDELGDLLFVVTNLARKLDVNPASALRRANAKFERRFRALELAAGSPRQLDLMGLNEMEELWQQVKAVDGKSLNGEKDS